MEVRLKGADGDARWFLTRAVPVRDGASVLRWFGTSTEVQALREARDAAESASRAKSDFLAAMSHELRTPLNAIGGYAELMEMGIRGPVSAEQQRDLARIRLSQQHLLGLIGGILDLSRIESGRVPYALADVALDPVLEDVEALIAPQAAANEQALDLPARGERDLAVHADRGNSQILLNLLSNAVRHTPTGTRIAVDVAAGRGRVRIAVTDTDGDIARGANPSRAIRAARAFATNVVPGVDSAGHQPRSGAGHGWRAHVDSIPGQGSTFLLTLPAGVLNESTIVKRTSELPAVLS